MANTSDFYDNDDCFFSTGEWLLAVTVGSIEVLTKLTLYYLHERLWQRVSYGNKETDD